MSFIVVPILQGQDVMDQAQFDIGKTSTIGLTRPRCHRSSQDVISSPFYVDHVSDAIDVKGPEIKEREVSVEVEKERVT